MIFSNILKTTVRHSLLESEITFINLSVCHQVTQKQKWSEAFMPKSYYPRHAVQKRLQRNSLILQLCFIVFKERIPFLLYTNDLLQSTVSSYGNAKFQDYYLDIRNLNSSEHITPKNCLNLIYEKTHTAFMRETGNVILEILVRNYSLTKKGFSSTVQLFIYLTSIHMSLRTDFIYYLLLPSDSGVLN